MALTAVTREDLDGDLDGDLGGGLAPFGGEPQGHGTGLGEASPSGARRAQSAIRIP